MKIMIMLIGGMFFSLHNCFSNTLDNAVFTTIAIPNDKIAFVGQKKMSRGKEPISELLEIKSDKMNVQKIGLPKDLVNREIIAIIPATDNKIILISQYTIERGDNPKLHLYNTMTKSWSFLGEVSCISFAKIKLEQEKIIFICEETTIKGEITFVDREIKIPSQLMQEKKILILPIKKLAVGNLVGEFEGLPQEWNKLKLSYKNIEKIFLP